MTVVEAAAVFWFLGVACGLSFALIIETLLTWKR